MSRLIVVLACLTCTGHGRRYRSGTSTEDQGNPIQALAKLLKSTHSSAAFSPSASGLSRPVSTFSRKSPVLMAEMRVDTKGDGGTYTEEEFREYYGDKFEEMWEAAEPAGDRKTFDELNIGDEVTGTVQRLAPFGAFVDIGCTSDALLHISQIKDDFVSDIYAELSEGQEVTAKIKELDAERMRIGITCRSGGGGGGGGGGARGNPEGTPLSELEVGQEITGTVKSIMGFGAFVDIGAQADALLHISEICNEFVSDVNEKLEIGQEVTGKIKEIDMDRNRLGMSCRDAEEGGYDEGGYE